MSVKFLRHAGSAQEGACMATPILWYTVHITRPTQAVPPKKECSRASEEEGE